MRRFSALLVALAVACGGGSQGPAVSSIDVLVSGGTPAQLSALGTTLQLAAVARDAGGQEIPGGTFAWTSADQSVATVDQNGLVTAVKNGGTAITAAFGTTRGSLTVTVAQVAQSLAIQPASQTVGPGVTLTFTAQPLDATSHPVAGAAAATWSVDDQTVATIDSASGVATTNPQLTSVKTAQVHATLAGQTASAALTVDPAKAPVSSVSLSATSGSLASVGETLQLSAVALNAAGNPVPGVSFSWSSSQPAFANVNAASGLVTAVANGTANITATGGGKSASAAIVVQQVLAEVVLTQPATATLLSFEQTLQLSASANDARHHPIAAAPLTWSSSAPSIASVNANGLVTSHANGAPTITVKSGSFQDSAALTVQQTVQVVALSPQAVAIAPNKSLDFQATGKDGTGHTVASAPAATWTSNDTRVTVDTNGHADAVGPFGFGNATGVSITASIAGVQASATLTVDPALTPIDHVAISVPIGGATLSSIGDTVQLSAQAEDKDGNPVPRHLIAWSVSDGSSDKVTVDQSGLVTATGNGQETIIAQASGISASKVVTVAQVPASVRVATSVLGASTLLTSLQDTLSLQATAFDARSHAIPGGTFSWSSDSSNAAVDQSGLVTAISNGPANIFANLGGITSTPGFPVTVQQAVSTIEVSASAATTLNSLGDTVQLTANAFDARHNPMTAAFVWSPTTGAAATVDQTGLVTAAVNGTTNVQASSGGKIGSLPVTVAQVPVSVSVSGSATLVSFNATAQLTASGLDARGHPIPGLGGATWRSDSTSVSVNGTGVVTANANGTANLFAKVGSVESPGFLVTVAQAVASVTVTGNAQLSSIGETSQLTATALDANGFALQPQPTNSLTWSVANGGGGGGGSVTVSSTGLVTAGNAGASTVNANIKGKTGSLLVTVLQLPVGAVPVSPSLATVAVGVTAQFTITGSDANGHAIRSADIVWLSSNPSVAAIGKNGLATGVSAGTVTLSATLNGVAGSNTAQLTVTGP